MRIDGFDWDAGNIEKNLLKHGVSCSQIERMFVEHRYVITPDVRHSICEQRFLAIGFVDNRSIFVAFSVRIVNEQHLIRPISARFMHEKEIKRYEKIFSSDDNR